MAEAHPISPLDVAAIAQAVRGLTLGARRATARISGLHAVRRPGDAMTFAEHRPYRPGDDLRRLDHRLSARHDAPWLKTFEDEAALALELVVDVTPSMRFGEGGPQGPSKYQVASQLAVALAVLADRGGEAVGLTLVTPAPVRLLRAQVRARQADSCAAALVHHPGGEAGAMAQGLAQAAALLTPRSWVVVLTDAVAPIEAWQAALGRLSRRGRTLTVVQLVHPDEPGAFCDVAGPLILEDLESGARIDVGQGQRRLLKERHAAWLRASEQAVRHVHGHFVVVSTAQSLTGAIKSVALPPKPLALRRF